MGTPGSPAGIRAHGCSRVVQHAICGSIQPASSKAPAFTNRIPGPPVDSENIGVPQVEQNARVTSPLIPVTVQLFSASAPSTRSASSGRPTTVAKALPVAF